MWRWERWNTQDKDVKELSRAEVFVGWKKDIVTIFVRVRALGNSSYTTKVLVMGQALGDSLVTSKVVGDYNFIC